MGRHGKGWRKNMFGSSSRTLKILPIFLRCLPDGKICAQLTAGADGHAKQRIGILLPMKATEFRK